MESTANASLSAKVAKYKLIARDALRMKLIVPRQTKLSNLEAETTRVQDAKKAFQHELDVLAYELTKLDQNHPDFAATKKACEENLAEQTKHLVSFDEQVKHLTELADEQKKGIKNIEEGVTKVSLEELNCLTNQMIEADALAQAKA